MTVPFAYVERRKLRDRAKWVYDHVPQSAHSVLDVGCSDGSVAAWLKDKAERVVGVDVDAAAIQAGSAWYSDIVLMLGSADALPFHDNEFDCVVFSEVLEHLPQKSERAS